MSKLRITRLKSHQIGQSNREDSKASDDLENKMQEKSLNEDSLNTESKICEINESQLKILNSSSMSDDDNLSVFANSRTIIKP